MKYSFFPQNNQFISASVTTGELNKALNTGPVHCKVFTTAYMQEKFRKICYYILCQLQLSAMFIFFEATEVGQLKGVCRTLSNICD